MRSAWLAFCLFGVLVGTARAQDVSTFPERPIRIEVGISAGGGNDVSARLVASRLSRILKRPAIVENKTGANGAIAARYVTSSAPDGYTLYFGGFGASHPLFTRDHSVDLLKEAEPVSAVMRFSYVYVVRASLPIYSFADLVKYSKKNRLVYGSNNIVGEVGTKLLQERTGLVATIVPYRGDPPIVTALLSGEVDFAGSGGQTYLAMIKAGKLRPIFVAAEKRNPMLKDTPTADEIGIKGFRLGWSVGAWAPKGTPKPIIDKLSAGIQAATHDSLVSKRLTETGVEVLGTSSTEQRKIVTSEVAYYEDVVRKTKFRPR